MPETTKESPFDFIKRLAGWTDKQAKIAMPDNGPSFPGVIIRPETDEKSWAEREYEKDHRGWERMP